MAENSKIEWTTHTFNPWWGCEKVSPACKHCYAERDAVRYGYSDSGSKFRIWGAGSVRRGMSQEHWRQPFIWDQKAKANGTKERVFCASMADVFEEFSGDVILPDGSTSTLTQERSGLFATIEQTPNLIWLLLTKRPHNIRRMIPGHWRDVPRPNVWFGTTVDDRQRAADRRAHLLKVPAAVRFLSCEPLIEDLGTINLEGIHWVICGGESGPGARPMSLDWARSLRDQCKAAGVAFFMKQLSQADTKAFKDFDGFPADLQVREFPKVEAADEARWLR